MKEKHFLRLSSSDECRVQDERKGKNCVPQCLAQPVAALEFDLMAILIIEDEEAHFQLMKRAIEKELPRASVHHLDNAAACFDELDGIRPDIIIVDYLMPGMNGIEFLTALRQMDRSVPVVMTTGQGDERIAVQAMKAGAYDYLTKDPHGHYLKTLPVTVHNAISRERAEQELRRYREHLEIIALLEQGRQSAASELLRDHLDRSRVKKTSGNPG